MCSFFFFLFISCSSVFSQLSLPLTVFPPVLFFCSFKFFFPFSVYFLFNFSLSIRTWTGLLCWLRRPGLRSSPPLKDGRMLVTLTMSSLRRLRSWPHHVSPESWLPQNRSSSQTSTTSLTGVSSPSRPSTAHTLNTVNQMDKRGPLPEHLFVRSTSVYLLLAVPFGTVFPPLTENVLPSLSFSWKIHGSPKCPFLSRALGFLMSGLHIYKFSSLMKSSFAGCSEKTLQNFCSKLIMCSFSEKHTF